MLFHNRLPPNSIESMANIMLSAAGIGSKFLVQKSYLMYFLIKYSCLKDGLVFLGVLYISVISSQRFWVWRFVSLFFADKASNVDSWSSSSILSACLCTLGKFSDAAKKAQGS